MNDFTDVALPYDVTPIYGMLSNSILEEGREVVVACCEMVI
jgi:hypothetical protein